MTSRHDQCDLTERISPRNYKSCTGGAKLFYGMVTEAIKGRALVGTAGARVGTRSVRDVRAARPSPGIPEVVVGVHDGQRGVQRRLRRGQRQPAVQRLVLRRRTGRAYVRARHCAVPAAFYARRARRVAFLYLASLPGMVYRLRCHRSAIPRGYAGIINIPPAAPCSIIL